MMSSIWSEKNSLGSGPGRFGGALFVETFHQWLPQICPHPDRNEGRRPRQEHLSEDTGKKDIHGDIFIFKLNIV